MKRQTLLSWKSKKIIVNLSFAEFAYSVLSVKEKKQVLMFFCCFFVVFFSQNCIFSVHYLCLCKYP